MVTPVLKLMSASVKLGVVADETEKQQRRSSVGKKKQEAEKTAVSAFLSCEI